MNDLEKQVRKAVRHYWKVRGVQSLSQGVVTGSRDQGQRSAVTGGKQLDGFIGLCVKLMTKAGLSNSQIYCSQRLELPGYFRAEKKWDLLAIDQGELIAVVEFKSQVGPSFGNNFNNRTEEAIGSATDLWAAYREGALNGSARPWLGYVFLLEDCARSQSPVAVKSPHYKVFAEFEGASYAKRYEILLTKLIRERLYDGVSLLLSPQPTTKRVNYSYPSHELSFENFAIGLTAHVSAYVERQK